MSREVYVNFCAKIDLPFFAKEACEERKTVTKLRSLIICSFLTWDDSLHTSLNGDEASEAVFPEGRAGHKMVFEYAVNVEEPFLPDFWKPYAPTDLASPQEYVEGVWQPHNTAWNPGFNL